MGLSRSISAKWKSTKTNPSADVLPKIADYFEVPVDYLLGHYPIIDMLKTVYQHTIKEKEKQYDDVINSYFDGLMKPKKG